MLSGRGDSSNYLFAGLNWKSEGDRGDGSSNYLQTVPTDFAVRLFRMKNVINVISILRLMSLKSLSKNKLESETLL